MESAGICEDDRLTLRYKPNISDSLNFTFHDILKCEERRYKAYGKYLICTEMVPYLNMRMTQFVMRLTYNQPVK